MPDNPPYHARHWNDRFNGESAIPELIVISFEHDDPVGSGDQVCISANPMSTIDPDFVSAVGSDGLRRSRVEATRDLLQPLPAQGQVEPEKPSQKESS